MNKRGVKQKRIKEKPNKKWMDQEVSEVLGFIQEEGNFEKPTAQIYYTNCIEKTKIDATWDLIRWKMRHLKGNFKKAEDWRKSIEAGLLETNQDISCIQGKLKKMCPHYEQLQDIFGEKAFPPSYEIYDTETGSTVPMPSENLNCLSPPSSCSEDVLVGKSEICLTDPLLEHTEVNIKSPKISSYSSIVTKGDTSPIQRFKEKLKKRGPKNSIDQLTMIQFQRNDLQKMKIELEKEKLFKDTEFNKRKFLLEEMKIKEEIERRKEEIGLRRLEIQKDERLRMLEMEKQERIQMYEIEMRYKYKKQE